MSNVAAVTAADFEKEVLQSDVPVLVDFWAVWCTPCRMIAPHVEAISQEFSGKARVYKVDVESEHEIAGRFNIAAIPTLLLFKDGKVADQIVGAVQKKDIVSKLQKLVE
jgi:thioredoxin 1